MTTSNTGERQSRMIWGIYGLPVVLSILSIAQMVRHHAWLFLGIQVLALAVLAGAISCLAKGARQSGAGAETTALATLLTRAAFFTCAAYVLVDLCAYMLLVVGQP